jgi:hypothetical protein
LRSNAFNDLIFNRAGIRESVRNSRSQQTGMSGPNLAGDVCATLSVSSQNLLCADAFPFCCADVDSLKFLG